MSRISYSTMVICAALCVNAYANTAKDYQKAQSYINSQGFSNGLNKSVSNAKSLLPIESEHPKEEAYYQNTNTILSASNEVTTAQNTVSGFVKKNALSRPKIEINESTQAIQFSKSIQQNAKAISDGTYQDCKKKIFTDTASIKKQCQTSLPFQFNCTKTLNVVIQKKQISEKTAADLSSRVKWFGGSEGEIILDQQEGIITDISMHVRDARDPWICGVTYGLKINGIKVADSRINCGRYLGDLQFDARNIEIPFKAGRAHLTLIGASFSGSPRGSVHFSYQKVQKVPVKSWRSSCSYIPSTCKVTHQQCLEQESTKVIDGVSVTAPCWKETETNQCGAPRSLSCTALQHQGCTQILSQCDQQEGGFCQQYTQTWDCPIKQSIGSGLQCGERFYCMDGDCQKVTHEENKTFGQSVTRLDAVSSASKEIKDQGRSSNQDPNAFRVFTGKPAFCREVVLGTLNCCADKGWAKGIFANCSGAEKDLGRAKEKGGLVVYVGRYCSTKAMGACLEHKRAYCIFPSRIAYDVQVGGRRAQLGRDFADPKTPDCSGLTQNELAHIQLDKIDFSNVIADERKKARFPNDNNAKSTIERKIKAMASQSEDYSK